ncbi:class I SAM-dependent DNA methyltransferase [Nocardioides sp. GCM10027113]|uniref:class I SAM-dependent DNA methyltransferase n=1 Tax=unclassified Nocardioides TaxID=2615069 RepID=UPI00361E6583
MSASDAILVGGDWISEHYLTTDATSQSFKARVLARRKEWDALEGDSVRTRFTGARSQLLSRLAELEEAPGLAAELRHDLLQILGWSALGLEHEATGPVDEVSRVGLEGVPGTALVSASPVDSVEDLLDKDAETLSEPYELEDGTVLCSVPRLLSTLFVRDGGPAFALVLAGRVALLAEKERWAEGRYLAIDLQLVCERNDATKGGEVDRALTCLSAESLAPDAEGNVWWSETLEESVKHTVGVSQDLREGVRLSIELIANEVVDRRRLLGLEPLPAEEAQPLAKQALRYLYRILFLLYAEASPELGVLPVGAPEYDQGYSIDRLRELVQVPLTTPQAEHGTHLYDSLGVLFRLVDRGYEPETGDEDGLSDPLRFRSLRADLFRPEAIAHVDEVRLGNARLQQVLQHLLLSKESRGRDRGFISYAELGINQLGAVYEGLMSYTGRFAETDLYEVAKNGDSSKGSWLVPVERSGGIDEKDFVTTEDPVTGERKAVLHRRGSFVFRLAGRERQQSASYYTPEVLTRFTVGQALEELLDQDGRQTTAEEILGLTVCEPALGSGAFAIEAVRQLAAEYLKRRQEELGERIDPEDYPRELQRVKAYLALHNVYGVDLNATAVELAEISLWLDTMVEGLHAPWFGLHLRRGNSLIGARRAVFRRSQVADKTWLTAVPEPVSNSEEITGRVPHFLLPAEGWGAAADVGKDIKELVPDAVAALKSWRKSIRGKPAKKQVDRLVDLGERVERLWQLAQRRLEIANEQVRRDIRLWDGDDREIKPAETKSSAGRHVSREEIEASLADVDGAYRRLRRVMDAWCALWFWPLTEDPDDGGVAPPSLEQWYDALGMILGSTGSAAYARKGDEALASAVTWDELETAEQLDRSFASAMPFDKVLAAHPWLKVCERIAEQQGFFHWELDFAPVFASGGFDLQVGNPPWVRPDWDEAAALAEFDVRFALSQQMASEVAAALRAQSLSQASVCREYVQSAADQLTIRAAVSAPQLFPHLTGLRPDLYRCFMERTWLHQTERGIVVLLHPESHFVEEKAKYLRCAAYERLRRHWQFSNELLLFEVHNTTRYGVHVYGSQRSRVDFIQALGLFHPDTVIRSLAHDGSGDVPGVKTDSGAWDVRPHRDRLVRVDEDVLTSWRDLVESPDVPPRQARMVGGLTVSMTRVLDRLAQAPRLGSLDFSYSQGWNERTDFVSGRFVRAWGMPDSWEDVILQGPNFHVHNLFSKFPNQSMRSNKDWSLIDLDELAAAALPVTSYKPSGSRRQYRQGFSRWGAEGASALDHYRLLWRSMVNTSNERTLISALVPPGAAHVHAVSGLGGVEPRQLVLSAGAAGALVVDFFVRNVSPATLNKEAMRRIPILPDDFLLADDVILRVSRLNFLTQAFGELWARVAEGSSRWTDWSGGLAYAGRPTLTNVEGSWSPGLPLRRASDRRQAQVELDALIAIGLGISVDDLCEVYRSEFSVLRFYDESQYVYDTLGRLVPKTVLAAWRKRGDAISEEERTATNASGNSYTYELPFATLDREADMRQAYAHFEKVLAERGGA